MAAACERLPFYLVGDFNLHHEDWNSRRSGSEASGRSNAETIASCLVEAGVCILNNEYAPDVATCVRTPSCSGTGAAVVGGHPSVIDLALTNEPLSCRNLEISPDWSKELESDHHPILLTIGRPPSTLDDMDDGKSTGQDRGGSPWSWSDTANHGQVSRRYHMNAKNKRWQELLPECSDAMLCGKLHVLGSQLQTDMARFTITSDTLNPVQVIESSTALLSEVIHQVCADVIGVKSPQRPGHSWWNKDRETLTRYRREVNEAYREHRSSPSALTQSTLTRARRVFRSRLQKAKDDHWNETVSHMTEDHSLVWKHFQRTTSRPSSNSNLFSFPNAKGVAPRSPSESLNNFAVSLISDFTPPPCMPASLDEQRTVDRLMGKRAQRPKPDESDRWIITLKEVTEQLTMQKTKSSAGPDSIPLLVLKFLGLACRQFLTCLYNLCFNTGYLPQAWRDSNVCPIYKDKAGNDRTSPSCYRAISVTSALMRSFEHIIYRHLRARTENSNYFHTLQFGFRPGRSTLDAIYYVLSTIRLSLQKVNQSDKPVVPVVFLDLVKAFDRVWHNKLLQLLDRAGIAGKVWQFIKAFLSNRRVRVVNQDVCSDWHDLHYGVPQGAVLSPFLFSVFINDVAIEIHREIPRIRVGLYADDIALFPALYEYPVGHKLSGRDSIQSDMQKALNMFDNWAGRTRQSFSRDKSQLVLFHLCQDRHQFDASMPLYLSSYHLTIVPRYTYLGLVMDSNMRWTSHTAETLTKLRRTVPLVSRLIRRDRPPTFAAIRRLVVSFLLPKITYGLPLWQPSPAKMRKLQSALIQPLRKVSGLMRTSHQLGAFTDSCIISIEAFFHRSALLLQKRLEQLCPEHPLYITYLREIAQWRRLTQVRAITVSSELASRLSPWNRPPPLRNPPPTQESICLSPFYSIIQDSYLKLLTQVHDQQPARSMNSSLPSTNSLVEDKEQEEEEEEKKEQRRPNRLPLHMTMTRRAPKDEQVHMTTRRERWNVVLPSGDSMRRPRGRGAEPKIDICPSRDNKLPFLRNYFEILPDGDGHEVKEDVNNDDLWQEMLEAKYEHDDAPPAAADADADAGDPVHRRLPPVNSYLIGKRKKRIMEESLDHITDDYQGLPTLELNRDDIKALAESYSIRQWMTDTSQQKTTSAPLLSLQRTTVIRLKTLHHTQQTAAITPLSCRRIVTMPLSAHRFSFTPRHLSILLAQLRANRALTLMMRARFKMDGQIEDGRCLHPGCKRKVLADTPHHILLYCPLYATHRHAFVQHLLNRTVFRDHLGNVDGFMQYASQPRRVIRPGTLAADQLYSALLGTPPIHCPDARDRLTGGNKKRRPLALLKYFVKGLSAFYQAVCAARAAHNPHFPPIT
jgi:hypothetical protein